MKDLVGVTDRVVVVKVVVKASSSISCRMTSVLAESAW